MKLFKTGGKVIWWAFLGFVSIVFLSIILICLGQGAIFNPVFRQNKSAATDAKYEVETKNNGETLAVMVTFQVLPNSRDELARIVRSSLEREIARNPTKEISAWAFDKAEKLIPDQAINYNPAQKTISKIDDVPNNR